MSESPEAAQRRAVVLTIGAEPSSRQPPPADQSTRASAGERKRGRGQTGGVRGTAPRAAPVAWAGYPVWGLAGSIVVLALSLAAWGAALSWMSRYSHALRFGTYSHLAHLSPPDSGQLGFGLNALCWALFTAAPAIALAGLAVKLARFPRVMEGISKLAKGLWRARGVNAHVRLACSLLALSLYAYAVFIPVAGGYPFDRMVVQGVAVPAIENVVTPINSAIVAPIRVAWLAATAIN